MTKVIVEDAGRFNHQYPRTASVDTSQGVLDLNRVSPTLFLGIDYYVSPDKNSLRYLDRKVYGQC